MTRVVVPVLRDGHVRGDLTGRLARLDLARGRHRSLAAQFDHIALLSAPAGVLLARIAARTGNPYGKYPAERAQILRDLAEGPDFYHWSGIGSVIWL